MQRKYFKNLSEEERREIKKKIFLELQLEDRAKVHPINPWKRIVSIAVAASLLAIASVLTLRYTEQKDNGRQLVAKTLTGEIKQLMLSDSSVVILNPSSALYSVKSYSTGKREVFLEGNGFFKVKKMSADRSFIVHAGTQSVIVLGTQFNVNTREGDVEVALTSGSVKVTSDDQETAPEVMKPGDKLNYKASDNKYQKSSVDPLLYSPWIQGEWRFRNTPLGEIATIISEYYNIGIRFNNPETKNLKMTAVFPVTNLETLLKVIMETLPVTITNQQQQLIIQ
jgi:ferric-dicitrate binding protein FerR (iron transport regulator)